MPWKSFALTAAFATCLTAIGCDEAQYDMSVDNYNEEVQEGREELNEAQADGAISFDELEELEDQNDEIREAAGEVAEQTGDLIEAKTD